MAKSVTVNFDDGTSHTYDNVPDDVTDDQVTQRAGQEFGDKIITGVGAPSASSTHTNPPQQELSMLEKAGGVVGTAVDFAEQHPGLVAGGYGLYKAGKVADTYMKGKKIEAEAAKTAAQTAAEQAAANRELQQQRILERQARVNPVAETPARPSPILDAQGRPITPSAPVAPEALPPEIGELRPGNEISRPGTTRLPSSGGPVAPETVPPRPTVGGPAAAEGSNFIESLAKKYGSAISRGATAVAESPVGRAMGTGLRVLGSAPVLGAQLMATPGNTGANYNFPTTGPMRGSEINPRTGRPWTPQELAQYNAMYNR